MARPAHIREQIITLLSRHHLLTAVEIGEHLDRLSQPANKTSIYRALQKLLADGVVCRQTLQSEQIVYELRSHHHDHLVCTTCGRMNSLECETTSPQNIQGFSIDHHHTTFFGLCKKCQHQSE